MRNAGSTAVDESGSPWRLQTRGGRRPNPRREEWFCGKCGTSNFLENPKCRGCGGRAPDKAIAAVKAAAGARAPAGVVTKAGSPPPGAIWSPGPKAPPGIGSGASAPWARGPSDAAARIAELEKALADKDKQLQMRHAHLFLLKISKQRLSWSLSFILM